MRLCPYCEEYARSAQNYCRMCGAHLTAAQEQHGESPSAYEAPEKYCGHCGRPRAECAGRHGA